ncbi:SDR family oxidoreductase [Leekyejoonella antrihumi]|uniref:SDR family oxidoreductase n=1 Tax=Leekyejoonella antrihumi TaxID=1660198 RepID=A0A563E0W7_9MICO|nr:SDR family oxidoreductase [Leekyejoonella antrihumi]TWP36188.1 SDR family oxidoreductase [Leekyejoonella antrihumi]
MTKTVFLTGSSSGFGKAAVAQFHAAGWHVVATMLESSVEVFHDTWDKQTDRLLVLPLDVTDPEATEASLDTAAAHFGGIDTIVNIAGFGMFHPFETTTAKDVRLLFDTNCFGPMTLIRQAIPHLRARGGGSIVNLTAGSAVVPEPLMAAYNASKAALDNLSEAIRYELAPQGISVRVIEPGFVPTTGFVQRIQETAAGRAIPEVYLDYVGQRLASFGMATGRALASADDVAQVILEAATDHSGQLRYLVGDDQIERMRMRHSTSEPEYDAWAWANFGPRSNDTALDAAAERATGSSPTTAA